jgi:purine-binding chemotaxis protein CheW
MNTPAVHALTQYLAFLLGNEIFFLEIGKVREVLDYTVIIRVPRMPEYLQGMINLRGSVVPVVDLRLKFGMPAADVTVSTCIIVVKGQGA